MSGSSPWYPSPRGTCAAAVAIALVAAFTDFLTEADYYPPILYGVALVMSVWTWSPAVLWTLAVSSALLTCLGAVWNLPPHEIANPVEFSISRASSPGSFSRSRSWWTA